MSDRVNPSSFHLEVLRAGKSSDSGAEIRIEPFLPAHKKTIYAFPVPDLCSGPLSVPVQLDLAAGDDDIKFSNPAGTCCVSNKRSLLAWAF